jgi:hypothetical protein
MKRSGHALARGGFLCAPWSLIDSDFRTDQALVFF